MIPPLFQDLSTAKRILVAGAGGGFDIFSGVPLALHLRASGRDVVLGNLSFVDLKQTNCEAIDPCAFLVTPETTDRSYFPEKFLIDWLALRGERQMPMIAFSHYIGVAARTQAFRNVIERFDIDAVVLVDGGTDSLIFGDEPGLGTIVEDASSCVAVNQLGLEKTFLVCLGFGIDHFHDVSHHSFLENAATMIRDGGFMGSFSLTREQAEGEALLDLIDYANQRMPQFHSIVCNSVASALRGEFGDFHATDRTKGQKLFINPLMTQYWCFRLRNVVARMRFADAISQTTTSNEIISEIRRMRTRTDLRQRKPIPL